MGFSFLTFWSRARLSRVKIRNYLLSLYPFAFTKISILFIYRRRFDSLFRIIFPKYSLVPTLTRNVLIFYAFYHRRKHLFLEVGFPFNLLSTGYGLPCSFRWGYEYEYG